MRSKNGTVTSRAIFPILKYDDAPRAIDFLCNSFGFEKFVVFPSAGESHARAQLKLGSNYVMIGATTTDKGPISTPQALGAAIGGIFVVLEDDADVDEHYRRAQATGATILSVPATGSIGGRNYTAADSEGYIWTFSSDRLA